MRISLLWKAHALANAEATALVDDGSDDLDPETMFADDARGRGLTLPEADDPRSDRDWIRAVVELHP